VKIFAINQAMSHNYMNEVKKRNRWLVLAMVVVVVVVAVMTLAAMVLIAFVVVILINITLQATQFEANDTIPISLCWLCL